MTENRRKELNALRLPLLSTKGRFRQKATAVVDDLDGHDKKPLVTSTVRSNKAQGDLYAIGRRGVPGERTVTNAKSGRSPHELGVAADIVPLIKGKPSWDMTNPEVVLFFTLLGRSAKAHELTWGGTWKRKDWAHVQAKDWKTLKGA